MFFCLNYGGKNDVKFCSVNSFYEGFHLKRIPVYLFVCIIRSIVKVMEQKGQGRMNYILTKGTLRSIAISENIFQIISRGSLLENKRLISFCPNVMLAFSQQINPFQVTGLFLYPLKSSKIFGFLIFQGV